MKLKALLLASMLCLTFGLAACSGTTAQTATQQAQAAERNLKAEHDAAFLARCDQSQLVAQEITNLCNRAKRINVQNMQSCIYLFAQNGSLISFFPVKGKVSSLNSYLLSGDKVVAKDYANYWGWGITTEAPDIDGAYGKNADGIFFFTADTDAYIEWQGDYFWSDQCLTVSASPLLIRDVPVPAPTNAAPATK